LQAALDLAQAGGSLTTLSAMRAPTDGTAFIQACPADVLFENTPVNYQTGQPALAHLETALQRGMHAITANKGPVVHAFQYLTSLAAAQNRRFYFESAVMDGAPLFSMWREALPAAELNAFRGVLNSTTNLILTLMETGMSFPDALQHCQRIGIAETDPSGDILGWDAAVKVAALVTVLMGHPLSPQQVDRRGIESIGAEMVADAASQGKRWKLICQAERSAETVQAQVSPQVIDQTDPLFPVMGTSSAITFHSDVLGALTLVETDPGPHTTAYGLLADFINATRSSPDQADA
jgi:homoserine dehydrogenase